MCRARCRSADCAACLHLYRLECTRPESQLFPQMVRCPQRDCADAARQRDADVLWLLGGHVAGHADYRGKSQERRNGWKITTPDAEKAIQNCWHVLLLVSTKLHDRRLGQTRSEITLPRRGMRSA